MERVLKVFDEHLSTLVERTVARAMATGLPFYRDAPVERLMASMHRAFLSMREDLVRGTVDAFAAHLLVVGKQRIQQGLSVGDLLVIIEHGFAVVSEALEGAFGSDLEPRIQWEKRGFQIAHAAVRQLWDVAIAARDEIIRAQTAEIYRLGATIVPLHRGILLLPLLGNVDEKRAEQIMSALLDAIVARQSSVVIVDVTGVNTVDTAVVGHLIRAAKATRLLGAEPVLVGIAPGVAQAMVDLGVDVASMSVRGTLEDGMAYALGRLGKRIIDMPQRR